MIPRVSRRAVTAPKKLGICRKNGADFLTLLHKLCHYATGSGDEADAVAVSCCAFDYIPTWRMIGHELYHYSVDHEFGNGERAFAILGCDCVTHETGDCILCAILQF